MLLTGWPRFFFNISAGIYDTMCVLSVRIRDAMTFSSCIESEVKYGSEEIELAKEL